MKSYKTIDEYIANYPKEVQVKLKEVRKIIKKAIPKADEAIKYGIPTFILNKKNTIHFGGFKKHIGLFPGPKVIAFFEKDLSKYVTTKGTIQFPLDKKIPLGLVTKISKFSAKQVLSK